MQESDVLSAAKGPTQGAQSDNAPQQRSNRLFPAADYDADAHTKGFRHKTPIPKKSPLEIKPKIEFLEQLLSDTTHSDAPILFSRTDHSMTVVTFEGEFICELIGHNTKVTAAKALSDNIVVTGDESGEIFLWDTSPIEGENKKRKPKQRDELKANHLIKRFHEHINAITTIEAINSQEFVSASMDGSCRYWSINAEQSNQTIMSIAKKPILSVAILSEDIALYCVERTTNKKLYSYDIVQCDRKKLSHKIIGQPDYSRTLFSGTISQIKLMPNAKLIFINQKEHSNSAFTTDKSMSLQGLSPAQILSNGRFAFMALKNQWNVVVTQQPLIDKEMIFIDDTVVEKSYSNNAAF